MCVDSGARHLIQNRVKFNAYYGCPFCYDKGEWYCGCVRYPVEKSLGLLRTPIQYWKDVEAYEKCKNIKNKRKSTIVSRGVKGPCAISAERNFNVIWGVTFDIMHTEFLGIVNFQYDLCITSKKVKEQIDSYLSQIKPIREMQKKPELIYKNYSNMKAKDWRNWILVYSMPVYNELFKNSLIEEDLLVHHAIIVNATYTLLKNEITECELDNCEDDLTGYVIDFESLYGLQNMRFNVHMLEHFAQSVKHNDPTWSHLTFPYESNMRMFSKV